MKLLLIGHTERYPVEQLQMQLFPDEPSEFVTQRFTGDGTVSSLSRGKKYLTATAEGREGRKNGLCFPQNSSGERRCAHDAADLTAELLSGCNKGARNRSPVGRALRGPADEAIDQMHAGGRLGKGRSAALEKTYFVTPERSRLCVGRIEAYLRGCEALEPG